MFASAAIEAAPAGEIREPAAVSEGESTVAPVAVVVSRFPAVTETFILRELIEMERQGARVLLVPLLRGELSTMHPEAELWHRRAMYTPFLDPAIVASNLRVLAAAPRRYLSTLLALLWEARASWNALAGTLGIYPKAVHLGRRLRELGVGHIHANFATHPAMAAYVMSRVHVPSQEFVPYSLTIHAHDIFITHAALPRKLAAASFVRSISRFNIDYLLDRFGPGRGPLTSELFRVIHCGIDVEAQPRRQAQGVPGRDRAARILCIAAMRPYKGLRFLIEAVRRIRDAGVDVHLTVIGQGPLRRELERQIADADLGDHIELAGTRTQAETAQALAEADVFVLPSVVAADGQMEGIPVSLMEALAAGLPVITSDLSGTPELVIDGETGRLVEPGRPDRLADTVLRCLERYDESLRWAANGRRLVAEEFAIGSNVRLLLDQIRASA